MKTLKEFCNENDLNVETYEKWALRQQYCSISEVPPNEIRTSKYLFEYDGPAGMYRFIDLENMTFEYVTIDTDWSWNSYSFDFPNNNSTKYITVDTERLNRIYVIKYPNCSRIYELKNNRQLYFVIELLFD